MSTNTAFKEEIISLYRKAILDNDNLSYEDKCIIDTYIMKEIRRAANNGCSSRIIFMRDFLPDKEKREYIENFCKEHELHLDCKFSCFTISGWSVGS